jgi:hypothetical protein
MNVPLRRNAGLAGLALLASAGTLVCCVLPAAMVAIGAGAALAGLVSAVPQLVWLSERKTLVFGIAGLLLAVAGASLWRARRLPCPTDSQQARRCATLRRWSVVLYAMALLSFTTGALFAFVLPWWSG